MDVLAKRACYLADMFTLLGRRALTAALFRTVTSTRFVSSFSNRENRSAQNSRTKTVEEKLAKKLCKFYGIKDGWKQKPLRGRALRNFRTDFGAKITYLLPI